MNEVNQKSFKVSVVLEGRQRTVGKWSAMQWDMLQVLSDLNGPDEIEGPIKLHESSTMAQYMWKGLKINLYADSSEGYWYNLLSEIPYAFVLCEHDTEDDQGIPHPILVTVNQDEANGHLEADNLVVSGPLPTDIRDSVEHFVIENYVPEQRKKRKRRDWFKESIEIGRKGS